MEGSEDEGEGKRGQDKANEGKSRQVRSFTSLMATILKSGNSSSSVQRLLLLSRPSRCEMLRATSGGRREEDELSICPHIFLMVRILMMASSIILCSVRPSRPKTLDAFFGRPAPTASATGDTGDTGYTGDAGRMDAGHAGDAVTGKGSTEKYPSRLLTT